MTKRLIIDLDACDGCTACTVTCPTATEPARTDAGLRRLRELATFALVCRRCTHASCIAACPFEALERDADGVIQRHNMRCVSCTSCVQACPFGTIYPDMVAFYANECGYCLEGDAEPPCVARCEKGAVTFRELADDDTDVHVVNERLAARASRWVAEEEVPA